MNINAFFYEHQVFTLDEFVKWKADQGTTNILSVHSAIKHYIKTDKLKRLRKGLYAVVPPNANPKDYNVDPYLLAGKVSDDAILAYHTALELHGLAYSSFGQFTFITTHKVTPFEYDQQQFQPVVIIPNKKNLMLHGVDIINRQGVDVKITSIARTFVDVLDHIELSGGLEEVYRSIENIAVLNVDEVISYCLSKSNARLAAKVGYFLEQRQGAFKVPADKLNNLLDAKPKSPQYLSKNLRKNCLFIKKWNIMMPLYVINKEWEEPNADI